MRRELSPPARAPSVSETGLECAACGQALLAGVPCLLTTCFLAAFSLQCPH